jgi:hypothetical protein
MSGFAAMSCVSKTAWAGRDNLSRMLLWSLVLPAVLAGAPPAPVTSINGVAWMAGCWEYKRDGNTLTAAIDGPVNGQTRRVEFPYRKGSCGS